MLLSPALTQAGSTGILLFPTPSLGDEPSPSGSQIAVKQLLSLDGMRWQGTHRQSQPTSPLLLHSRQTPPPSWAPARPLLAQSPARSAPQRGEHHVLQPSPKGWAVPSCGGSHGAATRASCAADGPALPWGAGQPGGPRGQRAQRRGAQLSPWASSPRRRSSLVAGGAGAGGSSVTRGQPKMWPYRRPPPQGQGSGQGCRGRDRTPRWPHTELHSPERLELLL